MAVASGAMEDQILQAETAGAGAGRVDWSDLGPRIASSLVLAGGGVLAAWFGGAWIAGACGAAVVIMSYEWARMSEPDAITPAFMFALAGALGAVMFASWGWLSYGAAWMAVCALVSATRRRSLAGIVETAGGTLYIGLPCAVFVWLRRQPEGLAIVLVLFAVIWAADIFAYFGGKLIGGPKVASGLSPNKTWSGIACGAIAGAAAGLGCGVVFGASAAVEGLWLLVGAVLAFTGLMGDLFESFLKRRFGVKDASKIIPGHGGVLDRIDGLMAATLLTGAVASFWPGVTAFLGAHP
jgi:phosphatidate cytidylyltransferase